MAGITTHRVKKVKFGVTRAAGLAPDGTISVWDSKGLGDYRVGENERDYSMSNDDDGVSRDQRVAFHELLEEGMEP